MAKIKINNRGFRELRRSPAAKKLVENTGKRIAEACGDGYVVKDQPGRNRARVVVVPDTPEAIRDNAENLTLIKNLDAGR